MLVKKIRKTIGRYGLMADDGLYLVALSGGADSVALLCALLDLGYRVEAVHCNFHLRGDESDRDERFCRELCKRLGVGIHVAHYDTKAYAGLHQVSIEMAARELRYRYFEQLRQDLQADGVCVAHHRDDSVETVLLNIIRGTGLKGLRGIQPRNGYVLRPMLEVTRDEIELFLRQRQQPFVTDSTNLTDDVTRNKIRLRLLPMLEELNPRVREALSTMARRLGEADEILEKTLEEKARQARLSPAPETRLNTASEARISTTPEARLNAASEAYDLQKLDSEHLIYYIASPRGFNPSQIAEMDDAVRSGTTGREWHSATHQALIDRDRLLIEPIDEGAFRPMRFPEEGRYVGQQLTIDLRRIVVDESFTPSREPRVATLDADKVRFPLTLRRVEAGDRFVPFGMKGSRLVSDFLTDRKLSLFEKRRQLVLTDGTGEILWVVGLRTNDRVRITTDTREAIRIAVE